MQQEMPSVFNRENPALQNMKFIKFFLFSWVTFALVDLDPGTQLGSLFLRYREHTSVECRHQPYKCYASAIYGVGMKFGPLSLNIELFAWDLVWRNLDVDYLILSCLIPFRILFASSRFSGVVFPRKSKRVLTVLWGFY